MFFVVLFLGPVNKGKSLAIASLWAWKVGLTPAQARALRLFDIFQVQSGHATRTPLRIRLDPNLKGLMVLLKPPQGEEIRMALTPEVVPQIIRARDTMQVTLAGPTTGPAMEFVDCPGDLVEDGKLIINSSELLNKIDFDFLCVLDEPGCPEAGLTIPGIQNALADYPGHAPKPVLLIIPKADSLVCESSLTDPVEAMANVLDSLGTHFPPCLLGAHSWWTNQTHNPPTVIERWQVLADAMERRNPEAAREFREFSRCTDGQVSKLYAILEGHARQGDLYARIRKDSYQIAATERDHEAMKREGAKFLGENGKMASNLLEAAAKFHEPKGGSGLMPAPELKGVPGNQDPTTLRKRCIAYGHALAADPRAHDVTTDDLWAAIIELHLLAIHGDAKRAVENLSPLLRLVPRIRDFRLRHTTAPEAVARDLGLGQGPAADLLSEAIRVVRGEPRREAFLKAFTNAPLEERLRSALAIHQDESIRRWGLQFELSTQRFKGLEARKARLEADIRKLKEGGHDDA